VLDGDALLSDEAAEDVDVKEGTEVADVAVVVDSGAAGVDAQGLAVGGREGFDRAAEGVEELEAARLRIGAGCDCLVADQLRSLFVCLVRQFRRKTRRSVAQPASFKFLLGNSS